MRTQTKEIQNHLTPKDAHRILEEGNKRFAENLKAQRNLKEQVLQTSTGQYPFAVVLSCIDSRVPAELVFDQGIGDIFSVRVAGNIINEDVLGSMEYSCKAVNLTNKLFSDRVPPKSSEIPYIVIEKIPLVFLSSCIWCPLYEASASLFAFF